MKNLKKILIALAVLALLVSSFTVLVVTADDDMQYTGTLTEAQTLLGNIPAMDDPNFTTDHRAEAMAALYVYIWENPIDPNTEGYAEFEAEWYKMSLQILNKYYGKYTSESDSKMKQKYFESTYSYIKDFPIPAGTPDPDGAGAEYISYDELFAAFELSNFNVMKGYYDTAVSKLADGDRATAITNLDSLYKRVASFPLIKPEASNFDKFYSDYNLLSLKVSENFITVFEDLKDAAAESGDNTEYKNYVRSYLSVMKDHMGKCPVDVETLPELRERYEALTPAIHQAELDQISFLFDDFKSFKVDEATMPFPELAKAAALAKVSKALSDSTIPESTDGYADLVANIKKAEEELAAVKEKRRQALGEQAKLYEYALTNNMSFRDFSSDDQTMGNPNADAGEYSERIKITDTGTSSGYDAYWRYTYSTGREGNTNYASLTQTYIKNGFVHSFDMMVEGRNGQHFKGATFSNEWQDSKDRIQGYEGNEFTMGYDAATDSIWFKQGNGFSSPVTVKNVAAEGQWFNVMFTYDNETQTGKLYIDYQPVFDIFYNHHPGDAAVKMVVRISHSADWQFVCYDNIRFFEGTTYRDVDKFNNMNSNEKFVYYVKYFLNNANDSKSRNTAYDNAESLLDEVKANIKAAEEEGELDELLTSAKACVESFEGYDYENQLADQVKAANLAQIVEKANAICGMVPTSATVKSINAEIANFENFIDENSEFIDKSKAEYNDSVRKVSEMKENVAKVDNTKAFVNALKQFSRATTVASMTKRANAAMEIYALARYDRVVDGEYVNKNFAMLDPLFADFEKTINGKDAVSTDDGYITVFAYYDMMDDIIAEQQKVENSSRIIKCIELLLAMDGYENTEEYWNENYEDVEFYISIIRDIVSVDNYDPTYAGIDEAILQYELIDAYFYELLQQEHIAIIGAELDKFVASKSYIEKIGICTYLDRYFATNTDINRELEEIKEFEYRLERYKAELEIFMEDYKGELETHTQYFIGIVKKMETLTTYAELKPYYDEAISSYYYAMNAETEEAISAVAKFDEYDRWLRGVETNATLFIAVSMDLDFVDILGAEAEFSLLSECAGYYECIDATYSDKLAERVAIYEKLVASYNGAVSNANEAIESSSDVVSALRAGQINSSILAVINQLYKN